MSFINHHDQEPFLSLYFDLDIRLLVGDVNLYTAFMTGPFLYIDNVTIYFLKDLMNGKKKMLRTTMIRTIHIP